MKIALIGPPILKYGYGPDTGFINMAINLKKYSDVDLSIFTLSSDKKIKKYLQSFGIDINVGSVKWNSFKNLLLRAQRGLYPSFVGKYIFLKFKREITKYDIIHGFFNSVDFFNKNRWKYNYKTISHARGDWFSYTTFLPYINTNFIELYDKMLGLFWYKSEYKTYSESDALICNSIYTSKFFENNNKFVIYNAVDNNIFKKYANIKKDIYNILFVGSLNIRKGLSNVLPVLADILNTNEKISFTIIGDGYEKQKIIRFLKKYKIFNRVNILGYVKHNDLPFFYNKAAFTIVPSLLEPFGFVNIESLSCGTPVIGSNIGGIPEIINNGKNGFLFNINDKMNLKSIIENLIGNKKLINKLGNKVIETVKKKFTWKIHVRKLLEVYESLK